jgi:hypothetical protein
MKYIIDFFVFDIISAKHVFHINIFYFKNNFTSNISLYCLHCYKEKIYLIKTKNLTENTSKEKIYFFLSSPRIEAIYNI